MKCKACDKDLSFIDLIESSDEDMCNNCLQEGACNHISTKLMRNKDRLTKEDLEGLFDIAL